MIIRNETTLNMENRQAVQRKAMLKSLLLPLIFVNIVTTGLFVWDWLQSKTLPAFSLALFIIVLAGSILFLTYGMLVKPKADSFDTLIIYEFDPNEQDFKLSSPNRRSAPENMIVPYKSISKVTQDTKRYYLWMPNKNALIIEKHAFTSGTNDEFSSLLRLHNLLK